MFEKIENYEELILPNYFPYLMNEITNTEILYFNDYIKRKFSENKIIQKLVNQFEENKNISKDIICKYWMHIYTLESVFYNDVNKELRIKKGHFYYPLIKMCYEMIKKGILEPTKKKVFRSSKISKNEYEYI
jgi:hypothetical protein